MSQQPPPPGNVPPPPATVLGGGPVPGPGAGAPPPPGYPGGAPAVGAPGGLGFGPPQAGTPLGGSTGPTGPTGKYAKKPPYRAPLVVLAGLVLIGVGVLVFVLAKGDGDGGGGSLDGAGAAEGFAALADDAEYTDGYSDLARCPFGSAKSLTRDVGDAIDGADDLADGSADQYLADSSGGIPESVYCTVQLDDEGGRGPVGASYYAGGTPRGDYAGWLEDTAFPDSDVTVDDPSGFRGGEIYRFCAEPSDDGSDRRCGADWVDEDDELVVGLFVTGERITAEDAEAALKLVLPEMVEGLAAEA